MKLICIRYIAGKETFYLRPDTALLRNNQPFYYPDFSGDLRGELCMVFRCCRLGRSIAARFAARYVDEVGLGLLLTAADIRTACIAQALPWDAAVGFDYSAAVSPEFLPVESLGNWKYELQGVNANMPLSASPYPALTASVIPMVSQYLTLKIGDYIFMPVSPEFPLQRGQQVSAVLDGRELLRTAVL